MSGSKGNLTCIRILWAGWMQVREDNHKLVCTGCTGIEDGFKSLLFHSGGRKSVSKTLTRTVPGRCHIDTVFSFRSPWVPRAEKFCSWKYICGSASTLSPHSLVSFSEKRFVSSPPHPMMLLTCSSGGHGDLPGTCGQLSLFKAELTRSYRAWLRKMLQIWEIEAKGASVWETPSLPIQISPLLSSKFNTHSWAFSLLLLQKKIF